jgi:cytochrome c553
MTRRARHSSGLAALLGAGLLWLASGAIGAPSYRDLRGIEPVHGDASAGANKATVCFACHGANGVPAAPMFPRLAGQHADYLYQRLLSFKQAKPKDAYYSTSAMTPYARNLSDADMRDLAAYFSAQEPPVSDTQPVGEGRGETLFEAGDPGRGIPPCQGCHGPNAAGPSVHTGPLLAAPSLRGQHAPYLIARLTSFRAARPSTTTNDFIMGGVARNLDDESIQAVARWLSSLSPQGDR